MFSQNPDSVQKSRPAITHTATTSVTVMIHHERVRMDFLCFTLEQTMAGTHSAPKPMIKCLLLRKEVIQPHLPVRLPCYDFVPIADPTFDGSLHKG